jgi:hypothetical protein
MWIGRAHSGTDQSSRNSTKDAMIFPPGAQSYPTKASDQYRCDSDQDKKERDGKRHGSCLTALRRPLA